MTGVAIGHFNEARESAPGRNGPVRHDLGPIELVAAASEKGHSIEIDQSAKRPRERSLGILLLTSGSARLQHYGYTCVLSQGDLVLINHAAPHVIEFLTSGSWVMLGVSPVDLRAYIPSCEHLCGRPLRSREGISQGTGELLQSIVAQLEIGIEPEFKGRIARNLLDTLATAFAIVLDRDIDGSPIICDRNARVRLYIERNLRDPELKPSSIARNLRLSPRYMRLIFSASKETVSAYILRRRLEECARDLADPALAGVSITEVAFSWGFNSGPHFARSFRNRFDCSPREFRGRAQGPRAT
jgi:AraC-like DNA-binding protein